MIALLFPYYSHSAPITNPNSMGSIWDWGYGSMAELFICGARAGRKIGGGTFQIREFL